VEGVVRVGDVDYRRVRVDSHILRNKGEKLCNQ